MQIRLPRMTRQLTISIVSCNRWTYPILLVILISVVLLSLLIPPLVGAQGPISEPLVSKQVEHPSNTPVAELFGGSYVDSTDDPGTGVSAHNGNNVDLTIGEEFNYIVTVSYPEGTTNDTFFIDQASPTTQIDPFDDTVIELISAEVIHVGSNLSGGLPPLGFLTIRDLNPPDGDGSQFQYGSGTTDVVNTADGVTDDRDRVVIRVRARMDDEDASGGPADDLPTANNIDGRDASNRVQIAWDFGANTRQRNGFGTVDIVEPNVVVSKSTISGTDLRPGDTATFELEIANIGTAPAYNLGVTDTLPNNGGTNFLTFAALDSTNSTCDEQSGFAVNSGSVPEVVFSFADLAVGASCIVRFNATIQPNLPVGDYTNSATVTSYDSRDNAANADNRNYNGGSDTSVITVVDCVSLTATTFAQLQAAVTDYNNNCLDGETLTVDLDGNTIQYTTALPALNNTTTAVLEIKDGTLDANANGHVLLMLDGTVIFDTTLLTGGAGPNGGAIQVEPNANVTLINTTVTGNSSVTAAALLNNGGTMTLSNVTVSTNTIAAANNSLGSVWNRINGANVPTLNLNNTIIANTIDTNGLAVPDCRNNAGTVNFSAGTSNLIEQDQAGGVTCDLAGTNTLSGDPVLGPLQDNGGQSDTLALLAGSAAINAGDNAVCAASPVNGVDQRGITRPQGVTCDIGAFEFNDLSSLTIIKQATPEDGMDFAFTSDIPGNGTFTLDDEASQTDSISQSITITDLVPGTYEITETLPSGWELDSASCSGGSDNGSLTGATLTVVLGAGEDVTCTFSNRLQTGNLTIVKAADPADGTDFAFTSDVPGNASFSLDVDNDPTLAKQITFADLVVGTYAITERVPADWELDSASCSGGSDNGSLTGATLTVVLGAREDVTCTFSNRLQTGNLTIVKAADPADGTDFAFTSDVPGNASFSLDVDSDPTLAEQITFADLVVGTYAITERVPADWELASANCTGGSDNGSLNGATLTVAVGAGEDVICTFSNSLQTGSLTIVKDANPADGTDFVFIGDLDSFTLDDASPDDGDAFTNTITFADLPSATYTITEVLPDGWQLDSASCTGGGDGGSLTGATLAVVLGVGEDLTCTFTNRRSSNPPTISTIYLPLMVNATPGSPDLVVDDLFATTNTVMVTIRNAGTRPVVKAFWVDVYINPSEVPTLNTPWNFIASQGVVWGIAANDMPINPGETRVLTLDTARPGADFTSLPPYPAGVTVYVLVDSINLETTYGAVQERDEANNLSQSVITTASTTSETIFLSATMQLPTLGDIPMRPSVP